MKHQKITILFTLLLAIAFGSQAHAQAPADLGIDKGVDHVTSLVHPDNFDHSIDVFNDLGFATTSVLLSPLGAKNSIIWFDDLTYLELATYTEVNPVTQPYVDFLDEFEGGKFYAIDVIDYTQTMAFLTSVSYGSFGPVPAPPLTIEGTTDVVGLTPLWDTVFLTGPIAPDDSLFFIDYDEAQIQQMFIDQPSLAPTPHLNTAESLDTVWLVVDDMPGAVAFYEGMGLTVGSSRKIPHLGGRGRRVGVGNNSITLLESYKPGIVADFEDTRGVGVLGASVKVSNLFIACLVITLNTGAQLPWVFHQGKLRFLIPPEFTNDFLIEMVW